MKEKIFSRIKDGLGKTSLSERTLQKKAEILAKIITSDELLTEAMMADVIDELKTYEGQINHAVAEAIKNQIPAPVTKDKVAVPEPKVDDDDGEFRKKMLAEIEALKAERQSEKDAIIKDSLKNEIIESLKSNGATSSTALKAALYEAGIDYGKPVEENVKAIRAFYDKEASDIPDAGTPFFGGGGGGAVNETEREAERLARKEKIRKDGRL